MKKKICFGVLVLLAVSISLRAQYYVKIKADSINITPDSTILFLENARGKITWQVSSDLSKWRTLTSSGDSLFLRIDSTAYYRAEITEGTCDPVHTDTILVGEKEIHTDSYSFWTDSTGGVFYLPDGIKVKIPPCAVNDSLYITIEPVDSVTSYYVLPPVVDKGRIFLGCLNAFPYDVTLKEPIKIQFPVNKFNPDDILILTGYDPFIDMAMNYNGYFLASSGFEFIEYNTTRLIPVRAEAIVYNKQETKSVEESKEVPDLTCKKGIIMVFSKESDYTGFTPSKSKMQETTGCQTLTRSQKTIFVDCGNLEEFDRSKEISSGCNPVITIMLEKEILKVGELIKATAVLKIGDLPLDNQRINISLSSGLTFDSSSEVTDKDGTFIFSISAKSPDNNGFIQCSSDVTYFLQEIEIMTSGGNEFTQNDKRSKTCSIKKRIICYDECTRPEELDCTGLSTDECEKVKRLLIDEIEITPEKLALREGTSCMFNVMAKNYLGDNIESKPVINWSPQNPGVATVSDDGLITAVSKGKTLIYANWCNKQAQNEVYVGDLCDSADYIIDISPRILFLGDEHKIETDCKFLDQTKNYLPGIHWKSNNPAVADVDSGGYVTTKSLGNTKIIVSWCDTTVTVPVSVRCKIDQWQGKLDATYIDECKEYICSILYDFNIYWDSIPFQKEKYFSTGSLFGSSFVTQTDIPKPVICGDNDPYHCNPGDWYEKWYFTPEVNSPVEGPVWSNERSGKLMFEGYFGWWREYTEQYPIPLPYVIGCYKIITKNEEYYDIIPTESQKLIFSNENHIDCYLYYKFGYNLVGEYFIEYLDFETEKARAHLVLDRIYSNYENIGSK